MKVMFTAFCFCGVAFIFWQKINKKKKKKRLWQNNEGLSAKFFFSLSWESFLAKSTVLLGNLGLKPF